MDVHVAVDKQLPDADAQIVGSPPMWVGPLTTVPPCRCTNDSMKPPSSPLKPEPKEVPRDSARRPQASPHAPRVAATPRHRRSPVCCYCCRRQDKKSCASLSAKDRDSSRQPRLGLLRTKPPSSPLKPEPKEVPRRGVSRLHNLCSALENAAHEPSRSVLPGGGCPETAML